MIILIFFSFASYLKISHSEIKSCETDALYHLKLMSELSMILGLNYVLYCNLFFRMNFFVAINSPK